MVNHKEKRGAPGRCGGSAFFKEVKELYTEKDIVRIAKRENNAKRSYLVVNRFQGKHIPVKPSDAFAMFDALAEQIKDIYSSERLLLIGFAETATAIGASVAGKLQTLYMQTTREIIPNVEYLFFSEEHSHATEQKLVKNDLDRICDSIDRIIFVEDEVTTGKTILNIIDILKKQYPQIQKYAVASLLNGMNEEALQRYKEKKIDLHFLVKTNHENYAEIADMYECDGKYVCASEKLEDIEGEASYLKVHSYLNARRLVDMKAYLDANKTLWETIRNKIDFALFCSVLVLGTEEFMYPALFVARELEKLGKEVKCHSTTRSPIAVSKAETYPLHTRYELKSLYDSDRITFIYEIGSYDCVVILTDAVSKDRQGLETLLGTLRMNGNQKIYVVRWCPK